MLLSSRSRAAEAAPATRREMLFDVAGSRIFSRTEEEARGARTEAGSREVSTEDFLEPI